MPCQLPSTVKSVRNCSPKILILQDAEYKDVLFVKIDYEAVVKLSDGFNGADLRNVCTEAGLFAIRLEREYVIQEDFMKAVRKVSDNKKLESKLDYKPV